MSYIVLLAVAAALGAGAGGSYGWRKGAEPGDLPAGVIATARLMGNASDQFVLRHDRRRQVGMAVAGALAGAVLGFLFIVIVAMSVAAGS